MNLFISGGAGFIGSNLVNKLVKFKDIKKIIVYDNFSSGKKWFLKKNNKIKIIKGDLKNQKKLNSAIKHTNLVYHFAANPDIAAAVKNQEVVEAFSGNNIETSIVNS